MVKNGKNKPPVSSSASLVLIGEAADFLDVSIDTIRRWDKAGKLQSVRPDGKNRYFSLAELKRLKFNRPLSISEAGEFLNISASTLRRLEKKGRIKPDRNGHGERLYGRRTLEQYLSDSDAGALKARKRPGLRRFLRRGSQKC